MDTRIWTERGESEARNDLRAGNLPRTEAELADAHGDLLAHVALCDGDENARIIVDNAHRRVDAEAGDTTRFLDSEAGRAAANADLAAAREAVAAGYAAEVRRIWAHEVRAWADGEPEDAGDLALCDGPDEAMATLAARVAATAALRPKEAQ